MDKKNTAIGVVLLLAAIASFYFSARYGTHPATAPTDSVATGSLTQPAAPAVGPASSPADAVITGTAPNPGGPEQLVTLANDFIEVNFTNRGGAIDSIGLKHHLAIKGEPGLYTLNAKKAAPALSFADFPGADAHTTYALVSQSATDVVYRVVTDKLEITRHYSLAKAPERDDYQLRHETTFRNLGDKPLTLPQARLNLGTAAPLSENDLGTYLNAGYYDGKDATFVARSALEGGGLIAAVGLKDGAPPPAIENPATVSWASVKNQFFAMILSPDEPGVGVRVERVKIVPLAPDTERRAYGITSFAEFNLRPLAVGASETLGANYFAGPKEYKRLANGDVFKHDEVKVMQFSTGLGKVFFSGFFAPLLLSIMTWVHTVVPSWGAAIIITTLLLKTIFLPFTLAASRSSKRMAKLQPHMAAMRTKYKDNPAKMQTETMKLFKENKVNPVGGCIPILITIPFFIGFFSMLQSVSELRFASFLWVQDLSAPDTVGHLFGFPINIMPLLMGTTMIFQMRLTPTPTTDAAQATMFKVMPVIFTMFCYNFASGLALYSTVNGLFTIVQQTIINRMPEPQLPINQTPGGGLPANTKNVTPKKKKV